ncbi:hypothetical protein C2I18_25995 [Paenibacillus sp. PK3_47]|uniref:metal-dependent hydrolase n=1 Tax=Paenibacillus sp. PK3_47 TaxID=2072642 RepID=UPI00201E0940|nr:hypothetical protein [Paenibacillus sp. PK3_47]UQZ36681.1 hypothetical protein C2I18_25995 [Paenibacillus sp. PK3_47]
MSVMLAMHVGTHLLAGCFIASFVFMRQDISFKDKLMILGLSAFFGIFPDLLGTRDTSPWSHSLIVMGIVMVPVVYLLRFFLQKYSYPMLYVCFAGSVMAHIFVDYLGHGVHLIYPFSRQAYTLPLIYLGDPTVWVPMLLGVVIFILPVVFKRKLIMNTLFAVFIVIYLGLKLATVAQIEQSISQKLTLTEEAGVKVYPLSEYQVTSMTDFWKMGFDVIDKQRSVRGIVPLLGGDPHLHVNVFYLMEGDIVVSNTGKDGIEEVYRVPASNRETSLEVTEESKVDSAGIIMARDRNGNTREFIFRNGKWAP